MDVQIKFLGDEHMAPATVDAVARTVKITPRFIAGARHAHLGTITVAGQTGKETKWVLVVDRRKGRVAVVPDVSTPTEFDNPGVEE